MALFLPSYIEIYNNTSDVYMVQVEEDKIFFKYAKWVVTAFAVISTIVATAGAASPLVAVLVANGVVEVVGLSTAALLAITSAAATISGISYASTAAGWALSTVIFFQDKLRDEGYVKILPGEKHKFQVIGNGPFGWRQASCRRIRVNPYNKEEVVMDTVYMRPIFSGALPFTTREHNIQYWIDKWGHEDYTVMRLSQKSRKAI
ncbi:uncharacterized protein LOC112343680 [Selaginella moellendorffii]|uniref:uncharacterized protein LOC112343680 n=1 Tax=Selaginella moellendorffii TaxID=88036 RepID=UPI000D1CA15E|nr:uncharacterized protein LOC112343680 [Selaginella moellendorffii]|eukprot:XP_024523328.1 uncharacterized protein LOC112343680 [Selaginella moellendorffii]